MSRRNRECCTTAKRKINEILFTFLLRKRILYQNQQNVLLQSQKMKIPRIIERFVRNSTN